ncbi:hypothetical protein LXA43DRAFT_1179542 [Ganoderma leucocontextum]|nr:hypothetical protein LXA43DRAFT_1179542 [Ganoderma leucocontextum]
MFPTATTPIHDRSTWDDAVFPATTPNRAIATTPRTHTAPATETQTPTQTPQASQTNVSTALRPVAQSAPQRHSGVDTTEVATLNDALGSAGVDLRAEEETLQRTNDQYYSYCPNEDRSRKQPDKPQFHTMYLGSKMRATGMTHKVPTIPKESIDYLALAVRFRLQGLLTAMIAAARHRTDAQFDRPASTYEDGQPMWSIKAPVWAFSVVAHLVILLGPTVCLHWDLTRTFTALFSLGMRHTKSSVRALGCHAWYTTTLVFFRPPHVEITIDTETDGEDESATEDDAISERRKRDEMLRSNFKLLPSIVDMGVRRANVSALLGQEVIDDKLVFAALRMLRYMSRKGGVTPAQRRIAFACRPVKPLIEECPQVSDVRTLTLDEILAQGVSVLRPSRGSEEVLGEIREVWFNLLNCHTAPLLDSDDQCGLANLAMNACDVLLDILDDPGLDFTMCKEELGDGAPSSPIKRSGAQDNAKGTDQPLPESQWNFAVKLFLVRDLFTITRAVFPPETFAELAEALLHYLNANKKYVIGNENSLQKARRHSDWDADVRVSVWQAFLDHWNAGDGSGSCSCESAVVLLSALFVEPSCWDMASEDIDVWDVFLRRAIDAALDHGIDATTLVDQIAGVIATNHSPSTPSAVRGADLLLSNVEIADAHQVPMEVLEFMNHTLNSAYLPVPRRKVMRMWLVRSLTRVIDACPQELCFSMLELLVDGLRAWIGDDFQVCTEEEYAADILPPYQMVLMSMQSLAPTSKVLDTLGPVLVTPFCGRKHKHTGAVDAFSEFWQATYPELPEPPCRYPEWVSMCFDAFLRCGKLLVLASVWLVQVHV